MELRCKFSENCSKYGTPRCSPTCMAFTFLHGVIGDKGLWGTRNVPEKYSDCTLKLLPKLSPDSTDKAVRKYGADVVTYVKDGVGLFLASAPHKDNSFGTGTGKTTSAITLLNDYVLARAREHLTGTDRLTHKSNPALFVKASDFQNIYNSQFRGTTEMQEVASQKYYRFKESMMLVELLVIDDIAIRSVTEAFTNELYEIIDYRASNEVATIYTSNIPLEELGDIYGERILSRIDGSTYVLYFSDIDHRKKARLK